MARPSATVAFLLLVSLLAVVAHCRSLEADASAGSTAVDETGPPNPTALLSEATALVETADETGPPNPSEAGATEVVPAEQDGFLRLPSHRLHRHPCRHGHLKRHLWWALRGHRFHHHHPRGEALDHMAVHGERRGAEEVESVAEPDPDRSVEDGHDEDVDAAKPIRDGHDEEDDATVKPWRKEMVRRSFHEAEHAAVMSWKKDMLWRMFRHGLRHHRHHHQKTEAEEEHEQEEEATVGAKPFHHHHDANEVEGEDKIMRRPFHFHHRCHHDEENEEKTRKPFNHGEDSDWEDEDDEVEEMIRRFRKAIMRQRFGHGRRFHHHHRHHQAEQTEQANGESTQAEEGGVVTWIKGLMNRF